MESSPGISITTQFSAFLAPLTLSDIPPSIREKASSLILDTMGCLRGATQTPIASQIAAVSSIFNGLGKASLAGSPQPAGSAQALYVNARLSNLLDMDETFPVGTHFGIGAVCAAIAGAEARVEEGRECTGADLLVAVVAGYEAAARVACAIGPIIMVENGEVKDYAKTWGVAAPVVIASCVAYFKALGPNDANAATLEQALGIAVSNIPLPIANRWTDSSAAADCKYCDAGWCSVAGMHAVTSALAGLTGIADIFDGEVGLPESCGAVEPRMESITEQLGELWFMADITFKPWPTCRWIHAPQTALRRLLEKHQPAPEKIKEVGIFTSPVSCGAQFTNSAPSTFCGYSFSYSHAVPMMLLKVPPGPKWFDPEIAESEAALKLRKIVRVEQLEESKYFARDVVRGQIRTMPGAVTVEMIDGKSWTETTRYSDGDPWDDATLYDRSKLENKFRTLIGAADGEGLIDWVSDLENTATLEPLSMFIRSSKITGF